MVVEVFLAMLVECIGDDLLGLEGRAENSLKELVASWVNIKCNGIGTTQCKQCFHQESQAGLMESKLLVMAFKAIFTSPSSANKVDGNGDGTDILKNSHRDNQTKQNACPRWMTQGIHNRKVM
ncbi:hypothetical protein BDR05DRAFT_949752 [Suillus weaverae]|nr:hypothetical protein BDR05DRAFT_949752 [Suillus weaverae]